MKILVVDDEELARERLLRLLGRLQPDNLCWQAAGGEQALLLVQEHDPDLVLLDIRMPGIDGIEVAAMLAAREQPPAVIFCTAYDEYALQALQHQAVAYLLKPVRERELEQALAVAGRVNRLQLASLQAATNVGEDGRPAEHGAQRKRLVSHTHRGVETMEVADVRCLLAQQKYVTACGPAGELLIPDTLKDLEREFGDRFLRVHRNALVALRHVVRLRRDDGGTWHVVLDSVDMQPAVSRRHLADVKQALVAD